jgi:hypothetical protein
MLEISTHHACETGEQTPLADPRSPQSIILSQSSMALATARTITPAVNRGQIAIEPAAAGCSAFRDFVHRRFADAGRRRVWLRSPTAGIRKPSQKRNF